MEEDDDCDASQQMEEDDDCDAAQMYDDDDDCEPGGIDCDESQAQEEDISPEPKFAVGDNVLAKWKPKKWYLAHVTHLCDGKYTVYFLDGQTKAGLAEADVRELESPNPPPRRSEMLNKTFYDSGDVDLAAGQWRVRRLVDNEYVCTRLTGGGRNAKNLENFDIGHVIRCFEQGAQSLRELGPTGGL